MVTSTDLASLSTPRKLMLGAAVVLLVDSFLPWYHASINVGPYHASASASGWHQIGVVAWLLLIVLLVVEGTRIFGVLPLDEARGELASLASAAATLLFGVIFVIVRLSDGGLGFGFWIGIVCLVALAYGAFGMYRSGDAMSTLQGMKAAPAADDPGPAGTPPPTA